MPLKKLLSRLLPPEIPTGHRPATGHVYERIQAIHGLTAKEKLALMDAYDEAVAIIDRFTAGDDM